MIQRVVPRSFRSWVRQFDPAYQWLKGELQIRDEHLRQLNSELQVRDEHLRQLNSEVQSRDERLQQLNSEVQSRDERLQQLNSEVQSRDEHLQQLKSEVQSRDERVQWLKSELQARDERLQEEFHRGILSVLYLDSEALRVARQHHLVGSKRFVVISHPRSGTNFLRDILNQHPKVFEAAEMFHTNPIVCSPREYLGKELLTPDDLDVYFTKLAAAKGVEAVGLTIFDRASAHSLSNEEVARLALRQPLRVVFLIRRNLLKAWVSLKRAATTGAWHLKASGSLVQWPHSVSPADALQRQIGPIDVGETLAWIAAVRSFLAQVERSLKERGKEYLTVYYEDLCLTDQSRTMTEVNRVLNFLGVEPMTDYEPTLARTASAEFYVSIPNRQELIDATGYDLDP